MTAPDQVDNGRVESGPAAEASAGDARRRCGFHAGQKIFGEGEPSDLAYLIVSGQVDLVKAGKAGDLHLAVLGAGEFLGEVDVLDDTVRSVSAVALKDTVLEALGKQQLLDLMRGEPETALRIVATLSRRLRHAGSLFDQPERARLNTPRRSLFARLREIFQPRALELNRIQVEFKPDALEIEERPLPFGAKAIVYTVLAMVVIGTIWASIATVDRIVIANGKLVTSANRIVVQPLATASIHSIKVRAGQVVENGQLLATLDWTFSKADEAAVRKQMVSSAAEMKRLEAQLALAKSPETAAPGAFSDDPAEQEAQARMFAGWKEERETLVAASASEIKELRSHIASLQADQADLVKQMDSALKLEAMRKELYSRGVGSLTNLLEAQRQVATDVRESDRIANELIETKKKIDSNRAQLQTRLEDMNAKAWDELQAARRAHDKSAEQLKKQERLTSLNELRSPAHAVVVEVVERSAGSVVKEGEQIVTLAPLDVPLEVEGMLEPKDVSYVRLGDFTRIKLEAFPYQKHGTLEGAVAAISGDAVDQEVAGRRVSAYKIKVGITRSDLREVPKDMALMPGMTASAEIKVGTRRLITFFLYPIMRTLDSGLRDP
jgi:HlyD family secretion protein